MAILAFQKPDKVVMINSTDYQGQFEFRPLEPGYGITVGNALRRILLSSLEGFAITTVRIEGVEHEFSTIKGVVEDVTEIILNLKQVRFKQQIESNDHEKVMITISGQSQLTAGDIGKFTSAFQVLNHDFVICNMDRNVKYSVENYRVEQKTDYEKLIIEITGDGSIHPKEALKDAAVILIQHFMLFSDEKITEDSGIKAADTETFDDDILKMRQLLKTRLVDMDLSVRALNCLKAADVDTLADLVSFNKNDLLKFRNFGKKSLTELEDLVRSRDLTFGMNLAKYKLDKD